VHGAWHAAWCWDAHFLDFFADKGFRAVAGSLRGYGASTLAQPLNSCSVADYVDDVRATVELLGCEPVLIGHSLGGIVVQKYLESLRTRAAVLMASHPPQRMPSRMTTPLLVVDGEHDSAYGTEAVIFPSMGHDMMLEPGWAQVAERIEGWVTDQGL
jgi:pimeloyl-ACP methyl ester carboxylesterase